MLDSYTQLQKGLEAAKSTVCASTNNMHPIFFLFLGIVVCVSGMASFNQIIWGCFALNSDWAGKSDCQNHICDEKKEGKVKGRRMMILGQIIAVEDFGGVGEEAALWLIDRPA